MQGFNVRNLELHPSLRPIVFDMKHRIETQFIDIKLIPSLVDAYAIRKAIFREIKREAATFNGEFLDVGCGMMPYRDYVLKNSTVTNYVGLDISNAIIYDNNIKADMFWDGDTIPTADNTFDCAMATEVLEHCPHPEKTLREVLRVLRPGAKLFLTVPFIWCLHEIPHDEYRYTPFSLRRHLEAAGFEVDSIRATGGWHASMATMLGAWVKDAPMRNFTRKILMPMCLPVVRYLTYLDGQYSWSFDKQIMILGLAATVRKPTIN